MLRSLYSGVSGLNANQEMMDTIGNNIANVNTTGFKASSVQFESLMSQTTSGAQSPTQTLGGIDPSQVGLGVRVAGVQTDFTEGTSEQTGRALDVSIQGNGFLIAQGNGQTYYTRDGSLNVDANGNLVTADGNLIQGWAADSTGQINTNTSLGTLTIPNGKQINAQATSTITLGGNLALPTQTDASGGTTTGTSAQTTVTVYNALGAAQNLGLTFTPDSTLPSGAPTGATSAWTVSGQFGANSSTSGSSSTTSSTLYFNGSGQLVGTNPAPTSNPTSTNEVTVQVPNASGTGTTSYTLDLAGLTANASAGTLTATQQDGFTAGTLQSFSIAASGVIDGVFSNGRTQALGQIALANFSNPSGLQAAGNSNFTSTANTGLPQVGVPGTGGIGSLSPGTLEASNVNLGQEFTNMIVSQRGFEANSKVITTSDQLLQTLIALKQ